MLSDVLGDILCGEYASRPTALVLHHPGSPRSGGHLPRLPQLLLAR